MNREADSYTYHVFWSDDDHGFVATVAEFPSLSHVSDDREDALDGLMSLVDDVLSDITEMGS